MKRAFTLVELMIVIVIVGVVYTLAVTKIKAPMQKTTQKPTLLTLKSYLSSFLDDAPSVSFICDDQCEKCAVYKQNKKVAEVTGFVDASIETYRYDFFLGAVTLPKRDACFEFDVAKNGVSSQIFIAYKGKVYDYMYYFQKTQVYDSLDEAVAAREKLTQEIR